MAYKKLKLWFDEDLAKMLADKIMAIQPNFNSKKFIQVLAKQLDELELKDRVERIADELHHSLGNSYTKNVTVCMQILGPENEEETGMFINYYWIMPIAKYVEKYGLNDFELSIKAIEEITKRNTGEYAIRPYIQQYPQKTLQAMLQWSTNKNKHVRRLSCEGLRPRLPWAKKLQQFIENPQPILPVLNNLKDDSSKYVQKSVANCINDILKDNEVIAQKLIEQWNVPDISKARKWIIKHALRNLLKQEDPWAMEMVRKIKK